MIAEELAIAREEEAIVKQEEVLVADELVREEVAKVAKDEILEDIAIHEHAPRHEIEEIREDIHSDTREEQLALEFLEAAFIH